MTTMLPSFSTFVSEVDRFAFPKMTAASYLPSLSSLNLPTLVNSTVSHQSEQNYFIAQKRKIDEVDPSPLPSISQNAPSTQQYTLQITSKPLSPPLQAKPSSSTSHRTSPIFSHKKEHSHKKQKVDSKNKPTELISVGSLQGVLSEVLAQASVEPEGDEEQNPEQDALASLFVKLRTQVYVQMIQYSETSKQYHSPTEKRIVCPFSSSCKKSLKGLGNLRRHIEWHLTRLEDDVRYQAKFLTGRITTKKACDLVLEELERTKKPVDSPLA